MHPQYESYAVDQFVSVRAEGAVGDGSTDEYATPLPHKCPLSERVLFSTDAIKTIFSKVRPLIIPLNAVH